MAPSLRDLMRREKESRKRSVSEGEDGPKSKQAKTSQPEQTHTTPEDKTHSEAPQTAVLEQKSVNQAAEPLSTAEPAPETPNVPGTSEDGQFKVPLPLNLTKMKEPAPDFEKLEREDSSTAGVLEETYELLEDDEFTEDAPELGLEPKTTDEPRKMEAEAEPEDPEGSEPLDENRLVYEQLNTAYCSNLDYEHESILREAGVKNPELYEALDSEGQDKNVITSANFGVSGLAVSASANLPVGFFDDRNVDAKARGKLTEKEAQAKIRELAKKRSSYLNEAKYIQEKFMESFREKRRLESDLQELSESQRVFEDRLNDIKGDLKLGPGSELPADLNVQIPGSNEDAELLAQYENLDYDDLSWMSRSII